MDKYTLYAGQFVPFAECFGAKEPAACPGCGVALAVRHVYKALNAKADITKATWQVPWQQDLLVSAKSLAGNPSLLSIPKADGANIQICFDNEAIDKVSPDDLFKKLPGIAAASGYAYVATACPSHPFDLIEKIGKACDCAGSAFILILCPCPIGWGFEPEFAVKLGRMAVETRLFPLYEIADGYRSITIDEPAPRPVKDYIARQQRFAAFKSKKIADLQSAVDAAFAALQEQAAKGN